MLQSTRDKYFQLIMHIFQLQKPQELLDKFKKLDDQTSFHYPELESRQKGALRQIKSLFLIANIHPLSGKILDNPIKHSSFYLLEDIVTLIGQNIDDVHYSYYAIIPPKQLIYPHVDTQPYFYKVNRYIVFFELDKNHKFIQKNSNFSSNSVFLFNPLETHSFINNSDSVPWHFIVFDVYK